MRESRCVLGLQLGFS
uniref:Uncharacterized protein n=1 Tax=Anguilla anguilla TaxID=7936 RepID=A0A0E9SL50_ANGAN